MDLDVSLILNGISTLCFFLGVFIINGFKHSVDKMQESIQKLNINIATLIEKDLNKDKTLDDHKIRMVKIETDIMGLTTKFEVIDHEIQGIKKRIDGLYSIDNKL